MDLQGWPVKTGKLWLAKTGRNQGVTQDEVLCSLAEKRLAGLYISGVDAQSRSTVKCEGWRWGSSWDWWSILLRRAPSSELTKLGLPHFHLGLFRDIATQNITLPPPQGCSVQSLSRVPLFETPGTAVPGLLMCVKTSLVVSLRRPRYLEADGKITNLMASFSCTQSFRGYKIIIMMSRAITV